DRLISRTASAGVRVDVTRCGQHRDLPASIDLSAYRIVQEALTNVVKHARTSSCRVLIGYGQDELILEVTDNGAGLPAMAGAGVPGRSLALAGAGQGAGALPEPDGAVLPAVSIGGSGHGIIGMRERVPVMDGIEATRRITASTDVRALILTTFDLDEYVFAALRAGASGFLLKDTLPADLLTAIRVVAAGDALLAPSVTRRLIGEFARIPEPGPGVP